MTQCCYKRFFAVWNGTGFHFSRLLSTSFSKFVVVSITGAQCEKNTFDGERCHYAALTHPIRQLLHDHKAITAQCMQRDPYQEFLRKWVLCVLSLIGYHGYRYLSLMECVHLSSLSRVCLFMCPQLVIPNCSKCLCLDPLEHLNSSTNVRIVRSSVTGTVILQNFGVVLFSVILVVNGFTEIKKTPKWEKHMEWSRQHPRTPKFKLNRTLHDRSLPKF